MKKKNVFKKIGKTLGKPFTKGDAVKCTAGAMLATAAVYGGYYAYEAIADRVREAKEKKLEALNDAIEVKVKEVAKTTDRV